MHRRTFHLSDQGRHFEGLHVPLQPGDVVEKFKSWAFSLRMQTGAEHTRSLGK